MVYACLFFYFGTNLLFDFWFVFIGFCHPTQSASRTYLARLIPAGREGEVFGLYATTGRAVSFLAPATFAGFVSIAVNQLGSNYAQSWGILGIV